MSSAFVFMFLLCFVNVVFMQGTGSGTNGNLRLCVVEGKGSYRKAPKYCPILEKEKSGIECVIGTDRLDCLRRISKGTVDFGVFSPEDLIAAQWAGIEVLVTNELRNRARPYERTVVAVVNRRILPDTSSTLHAILRNTTLCHPGVDLDDIRPMSDTLSGYLETLVLEKSCDPKLSLTENRLKALSGFFGKACKAGPWVPDKTRDAELKQEYPSLCAACSSPKRCATTDRYWGDTGALTCLDDSVGDIAWAELDDVTAYFGINSKDPNSYPARSNFAYLCRDGTWQPLQNNSNPCVWLHRPWRIVVSKRKAAEEVMKLTYKLMNSSAIVDKHWLSSLAFLLEAHKAVPEPVQPPKTPLDYLDGAKGFKEAYSQSGCDPPRYITLCTTSLLAKNKCEWLSEAGNVYGLAPPLQCIVKESTQECLKAVQNGDSDVTVADSDWFVAGKRDYSLTSILHEVTPIVEKMNTIVAYVKNDSKITTMADLRGKRAAFPRYDGAAWHAIQHYISDIEKISCKTYLNDYFQEICAPGVENSVNTEKGIAKNCYETGEEEALRSLVEGKSDVAFVSMTAYNMMRANQDQDLRAKDAKNIVPICPADNEKYCFISWSNIGHMFASNNLTIVKRREIINVFTKLDQMFGKHPPFHSPMFSMYGPFNYQLDVLFHNNTRSLVTDNVLKTHPYDKIPFNFERNILDMANITCSFGTKITSSLVMLYFVTLVASVMYI